MLRKINQFETLLNNYNTTFSELLNDTNLKISQLKPSYTLLINNNNSKLNVSEGATIKLPDKLRNYDLLFWEFFGYYHIVGFGKECVQDSSTTYRYKITTITNTNYGGYFDFIPAADELSFLIKATNLKLRVLYGIKINSGF